MIFITYTKSVTTLPLPFFISNKKNITLLEIRLQVTHVIS